MSLAPFPVQKLAGRQVISITGDGAVAWLDNLVTCELGGLAPGQAAYGALLTPQGKILYDMFVIRDGERVLLDTGDADGLLKRLLIYRLRAKLDIRIEAALGVGASSERADRGIVFADPRQAALGFRSIAAKDLLIEGDGYDARRIRLGIADCAADFASESVFPHEINMDQFGGVSFTKGCYVGQEVVSRMQHRGTARNRILPVRFDGPAPPAKTEIKSGDTRIGETLSTCGQRGLTLVRIDRLAETSAPLTAGSATLHIERPDWFKINVTIPEMAQ